MLGMKLQTVLSRFKELAKSAPPAPKSSSSSSSVGVTGFKGSEVLTRIRGCKVGFLLFYPKSL